MFTPTQDTVDKLKRVVNNKKLLTMPWNGVS